MLKNSLVILPLDHQLNRTSDHYRQTIRILTDHHNTVVAYKAYLNAINFRRAFQFRSHYKFIKKQQKFLYTVNPFHPLPFERLQSIYRLNIKLSFILSLIRIKFFTKPHQPIILWIIHPRHYWMALLIKKVFFNSIVVYDNLDYNSSSDPKEEKLLRQAEKYLLKNAQVNTVHSNALLKLHQKTNPNIKLVPSGFRFEEFKMNRPTNFKKHRKPTIGYIGTINYRLDFLLLNQLCANNQNWQFVFVGPEYKENPDQVKYAKTNFNKLLRLPNVARLDYQNPKKLPQIISRWHIGMIPYDLSVPLNQYCNPLKLMEYFYLGLPVISTPIPSIKKYSKLIKFGRSYKDWIKHINFLLKHPLSPATKNQMKQIATDNSWENKLTTISTVIENINEH